MASPDWSRTKRDLAMQMARVDRTLGLNTVRVWVQDAREWNWVAVRRAAEARRDQLARGGVSL